MVGKDAGITKSKGKEKGKEPDRFTSKLSASASGLLQGALGNLGANDLQNAISSSGKLTSDTSPNSPSYWLQELPLRSPGTIISKQSTSSLSGFRSSTNQLPRNMEFEEFVESGSSTPDLDLYRAESAAAWTTHQTHDLTGNSRGVDTEESFDGTQLSLTEPETSSLQQYLAEFRTATSPSLVRESPDVADSTAASLHEESSKTLRSPAHGFADVDNISQSQSRPFHRQSHHDFVSESVQANGHPLTRLSMILDHITDTAQSLSSYQDLSCSQAERTNFPHQSYSALRGLDQMPFQGAGVQPTSEVVAQHTSDQKGTNERKPDEKSMEEQTTPPFHCPWIRCHQRFNDATKLSSHANGHTQYSCVHDDCVAQFSNHQDWSEHIAIPHHDLQEGSFPMTLVSSGGTICAVPVNNHSSAADPHCSPQTRVDESVIT
jgi:hypothetical protein